MFNIYLLFLFIILVCLGIEYARLTRSLHKIPIRILVNGTRGKSTLVKIIHEILRQSGQKAFAKTTGDEPLEYLPDGQIKMISRNAPASIIENIGILRHWANEFPEAIVMECMALQPEAQRNLSTHIFKPNYILISNIHFDHAEAMGDQLREMVSTILECINDSANILTTNQVEEKLKQFGKSLANIRIAKAERFPERFYSIPSQLVDQNWSLIKSMTDQLNINLQIAYHCFREVHLSMNRKVSIRNPNLNYSFGNLFSINDHESAAMFIQHSRQNQISKAQEVVLFNARSDRPVRTKYFAELVLQEFPQNINIWITGSGKQLAKNIFRRKNIGCNSITLMSPKEVLDKLKSRFDIPATIYGIGNLCGMQEIVEHLSTMKSQNI